jgi:cell division transport system permease protein
VKILKYFFDTAFKNIWIDKWANLLTIISISIGLSILCAFVMITFNMDSVIQRWSNSFGLVVYLDQDISKEMEATLQGQFQQDSDITEVKYISNDEALEEVKKSLGSNAVLLDDFHQNPLPSTFELKIKSSLLDPIIIKKKAADIQGLAGVNDVLYGEKWLSSLSMIAKTMKIVAIIFACAIFIATTFTTYNTIKIFYYRRKEEIKTLKLLGATNTFTRLPFLIEGLFVGITGGVISALFILGLSSFTTLKIIEFMPSIKAIMAPFPFQIYLLIPVTGALMSLLGSYIAMGKIRF